MNYSYAKFSHYANGNLYYHIYGYDAEAAKRNSFNGSDYYLDEPTDKVKSEIVIPVSEIKSGEIFGHEIKIEHLGRWMQ